MEMPLRYDTSSDKGSAKVLASPPAYTPKPIWQFFPGFSFIFDNPEGSLAQLDTHQQIAISEEALETIDLYWSISKAVSIMDPRALAEYFHFFVLPSSTYHVTVWDGVNKGNADWLSPESKKRFEECFAGGVKSALNNWPPFSVPRQFWREYRRIDPIRLRYNGLRARGNTVLVVELAAHDEESARLLEGIKKQRDGLDAFFANYGKPENHTLIPHVAVGYFSNSTLGQSALFQYMDSWMAVFDRTLKGKCIEFRSIDLYGFVDMITYFKPVGVSDD